LPFSSIPCKKKVSCSWAHYQCAFIRFSTDQHLLSVVEADSNGVTGPNNLHCLQFHNGQRYFEPQHCMIKLNTTFKKSHQQICVCGFALGIPRIEATTLAIVQVAAKDTETSNLQLPRTQDWGDTVGGKCTDLNIDTLNSSAVRSTYLANIAVSYLLTLAFRYRILLQDLAIGGRGYFNSTEVTTFTRNKDGCYNIVLNNLDADIDHPLYLCKFSPDADLVAQGSGNIGPQSLFQASFRLNNPLRRDTFVIGSGSYLVNSIPTVQFEAHNPGVWILHCHIEWHLASGFAGLL
ncbi:hypothetical protein PSTT_06918, partial [Puccinia striiformis]